jgi:IS30 family transposase
MTRQKFFSETQKREIWDRHRSGESNSSIARSFGRYPSAIHQVIRRSGGVKPPEPKRSPRALTAVDREEISRGLAAQKSLREIAREIHRAPSTVSREIARNGGCARYRAQSAERRALREARRPKVAKLAQCARLRRAVEAKLEKNWSPEQISNWLTVTYPHDEDMRVSHETIYMSLFVQGRGALRQELHRALRSGRATRRPKSSSKDGRGKIPEMVMISDRPAEVADRAVPGHWEGDLIVGEGRSCIGTLVERSTRYVILLKLDNGTAEHVRKVMARRIQGLPAELRRSITWDQGKELAQHREFTVDTGVQVYFCDPHSPWQRGSNENTNGLLRQYFPKGTKLSGHSQRDLDRVARELNERPRKTLKWMTPLEKLDEAVATTA